MSHETVRKATAAQFREIAATLVQTTPDDLDFDRAQYLIGHKGEWTPEVQNVLWGRPLVSTDVESLLRAWEELYLAVFKRQVDFSGLVVPTHQAGFDRLIVVAEGMTPNVAFRACQDRFPTWSYYDDLDKAVVKSDREPTQSYAVWVRDRVEADEELKDLSATELREQEVSGVTLLERLILELKFHEETGDHLDKRMVTLCSGSRSSDGGVPDVDWSVGKLCVGWRRPDGRDGDLRSRQAVS